MFTFMRFAVLCFTLISSCYLRSVEWVYVISESPSGVVAINTVNNTAVTLVPLIGDPTYVAITPDGSKMYVTNYDNDQVDVIAVATNTVIDTIAVGSEPYGIAITPDGRLVYVTNYDSATVSVIDVATGNVIDTIEVGLGPTAVAITPDGRLAYVTNYESATVSVIDVATGNVIDTIEVGLFPLGVAITPDGRLVYVTNASSDTVSVIDVVTGNVIDTIAVGSEPYGIAITPDGRLVYVTNYDSATVSVIDVATGNVIDTIAVGSEPFGIAITPDGRFVYVSNFNNSGTVSVIEVATGNVIDTIPLETGLEGIAITPDQAPFAAFTVTPGLAGQPTFFDASASFSPNGTIALYQWNFGDGTVVTTMDPLISHVYAAAGSYPVTLTVTNSNGTSTTVVFTGQTVSRNGGPSATTTQIVSIGSVSINFVGTVCKDKFLNETHYYLEATWTPVPGTLFYRIYKRDRVVATVNSSKLVFKDCLSSRREAHLYSIAAVNANFIESARISIQIK